MKEKKFLLGIIIINKENPTLQSGLTIIIFSIITCYIIFDCGDNPKLGYFYSEIKGIKIPYNDKYFKDLQISALLHNIRVYKYMRYEKSVNDALILKDKQRKEEILLREFNKLL